MEPWIFFVLLAHSLQGLLAGVPVEVTPERIILLENRPLEVRCRVREPITYCRFSVQGVSDVLSLRAGLPPHQGIQYLGAGLEKGECGMLIQSVSSKHSGVIQCSMGLINDPTESTGNMTLIVARPPDPPLLQAYPGSTYRDAFREGETIQVNCRISNARPVANISWYLGSEPIYDRLGPPFTEEENGLFSISQNLTRKLSYTDHGKDLKCVAGHIALAQGNINHSIYKLNVRFPPKPKSQELEKFGFTIGQPGKIVVTFQANPLPDIVWKVDQDDLREGTRDRTGRFEAGILQQKGAGTWDATLNINTVRAEEVEKRYTLIARNELGHESYKVAISTSPEPPADITAGTIVGIVIAVLVILLLVFILIFARTTGRWCFAGGVPRPPGESLPSRRWFLGKKAPEAPQKVNSLVYKDYTLVHYEDGRKSYVSPEERSQLLLDDRFGSSRMSLEKEKEKEKQELQAEAVDTPSESESEYEIPLEESRRKPKSWEELARISDGTDVRRNSSCLGTECPGDNGRINLPPYIVPFETSLTLPMTKGKRKKKRCGRRVKTQPFELHSSGEEPENVKRFSLKEWAAANRKSSGAGEEERAREEATKRFSTPWKKAAEKGSEESPRRRSTAEESEESERSKTRNGKDKERIEEEEGKSGGIEGREEGEENKKCEEEELTSKLEPPVEFFPQGRFLPEEEPGAKQKKRYSYGFPLPRLPRFPAEAPKEKVRRTKKMDPNPLKKMFGIRGPLLPSADSEGTAKRSVEERGEGEQEGVEGSHAEGAMGDDESDTESADHGSADKSSVSKLTSEKQPKKLMNSLLGSLKKGKNRDKVADNDPAKNPSSFEITVKEQSEDVAPAEVLRTEGIVYAELDMARSPGNVMRREDEKTEYAEIIYPGANRATVERAPEELRKSRENLSSSREDLTEADEAFATMTTPEGKKEAAV